MEKSMTRQLVEMRIPFFVIQPALVIDDESIDEDTEGPQKTTLITRGQLKSLQRRMIGLLEDLCKE